jgi:hypothetical protein
MMLGRWLAEGNSNDPYNSIGMVFKEARAPYNAKAKKERSDTVVRDAMQLAWSSWVTRLPAAIEAILPNVGDKY